MGSAMSVWDRCSFAASAQGEQARPAVRGEGIESDPVFTAEIVHNRLIHIVSAQVIVSRHRYNLDNVFKAVYHAHIERPAAEIHQQKPAILPPVAWL